MRSSRGMFGGQPSMTTPSPFPWDSPHVVIFNAFLLPFLFRFEKPDALGQVRDALIFLSDLCLKSQIPSTPPKERRAGKLQINSKSQALNYKLTRLRRVNLKLQTGSTRSA